MRTFQYNDRYHVGNGDFATETTLKPTCLGAGVGVLITNAFTILASFAKLATMGYVIVNIVRLANLECL